MNKLKKKLNSELDSRGRLLDENDDLHKKLDNLVKQNRDKDTMIEQKDEEIRRLRKMYEAERAEVDRLR